MQVGQSSLLHRVRTRLHYEYAISGCKLQMRLQLRCGLSSSKNIIRRTKKSSIYHDHSYWQCDQIVPIGKWQHHHHHHHHQKNIWNQTPCHSRFPAGSLAVHIEDHLQSNWVIIFGLGIICNRGSFPVLYNSPLSDLI